MKLDPRGLRSSVCGVLALALLTGQGPVARASDDASACAVFARVLAAARASGALDRALGEHPFVLTRTFYGPSGEVARITSSLMTYRVSVPEVGGLAVAVEVLPEARAREVRFTYTVGEDGRLQALRTEHPQGESRADRAPEGDLALVSVVRGRPRGARVPWEDTILPKVVGAFVLPMLHDQGVPDALTFRDLTPFAQLRAPAVLRRVRGADGGVTFVTEEGDAEPATEVVVAAGGRVASIRTRSWRRGGHPEAVWKSVRLDPARAAALRAAWGPSPTRPR